MWLIFLGGSNCVNSFDNVYYYYHHYYRNNAILFLKYSTMYPSCYNQSLLISHVLMAMNLRSRQAQSESLVDSHSSQSAAVFFRNPQRCFRERGRSLSGSARDYCGGLRLCCSSHISKKICEFEPGSPQDTVGNFGYFLRRLWIDFSFEKWPPATSSRFDCCVMQ